MILPHILDIVAVCAAKGVKYAIISPGSRSAALTIAFEEHPGIKIIMVPDERSAGFIAMGIAQQTEVPSVLVCTSGSALLNYSPAISEAFYQEIPLLILSADRPPEWIDQYDGQTIRQKGAFGEHVKRSFQLPTNPDLKEELWESNRVINEGLNQATSLPQGPVHINVPIREPFYPSQDEAIEFDEPRIINRVKSAISIDKSSLNELAEIWNKAEKPILIIGHGDPDAKLEKALVEFKKHTGVTIINDIIGNQHSIEGAIKHQDATLNPANSGIESLKPDLVISVGKSLISKNLKLFLRKNPPANHWHIQQTETLNDSLQNLTHQVICEPSDFFKSLRSLVKASDKNYADLWNKADQKASDHINQFLRNTNSEFEAYAKVLAHIPENTQIQLANSMAVRYANIIGLDSDKRNTVFANRGTSGIDGSNGTAVGSSIVNQETVTLLTGDMAFLYDRNAFWHDEPLANLRIVVFNNAGGGIFRMIPGPTNQPTYERIFETKHQLTAEATAKEFGMEYQAATDIASLEELLKDFFNLSNGPKVIEFFSDAESNTHTFNQFKSLFKA